jgi:transcriptional regulator with XRE-family HTH domain
MGRRRDLMDEKALEFGQYLKELRKKKGLTLTELGDQIGLSNPYLSQIENGKRGIPTADLLEKLAKPLGVHFITLLDKAWKIKKERNIIPDPNLFDYDLASLLHDEKINIHGQRITEKEREQIMGMLQVFFPKKVGDGNSSTKDLTDNTSAVDSGTRKMDNDKKDT